MKNLSDVSIEKALQQLEGWTLLSEKSIEKTFLFDDFQKAFSFMAACAEYAEKINHHPDWSNSYNKVMVVLTTHDVGGLSDLDFKMATFMDRNSKI